ncbi:Rieske (2Fe-2S) protein [Agarilytica rhodophyticola]|uniref:Rieske (2Fe-2S) protein n=1 Tax=Agarilytica rhodophyticola TaxID=1737490 RepID=UPI000B34781F|nr:Rieske (2Fe-2S) protein [Agarilytica rhodophyticola]
MPFYPLEQLNRLHDGYQREFNIAGNNLLLCQLDGSVYIVENRCPHMDVPLTHAVQLPDQRLRCRAHGIEFNLNTGRADGPLADTLPCLKKIHAVYEGTQIGVDTDHL